MKFREITTEEFDKNVFTAIDKEWMLITAEKDGKVNTMTASWGGMGVLWYKKVIFAFIRPQRYTNEFVDGAERFSITFFDEKYRKELSYLGTTSGRNESKIEKANFTVAKENETPYFEQANTVIICRKLYKQRLTADSFTDSAVNDRCYAKNDQHYMYIGEIEKILVYETDN